MKDRNRHLEYKIKLNVLQQQRHDNTEGLNKKHEP